MEPVFISYCSRNVRAAEALADDVQALGHKVWLDRELAGGHIWWDQILASVRDCGVLVLAVSPEALDSEACRRECAYAVELGKPVLPVIIADGVSPGLLPPGLSQIQLLDYRKRDRDAAFALARAFSQLPPAAALPDPLPEPPERPVSAMDALNAMVVSPDDLKFEEQTALFVRLREYLSDPVHRDDARQLIDKLRRRDDLYAKVAAQIDSALDRETSARASAAETTQKAKPKPAPRPATPLKPAKKPRGFFARMVRRFAISMAVLWCVAFVLALVQTGIRL